MYVPRALRSQNVASMDSNKTTVVIDKTLIPAYETVDTAAELQRVVVNDSSSETINEPLSAACDAKLSSTATDCSQQSARSRRDKKTGCHTGKKQKTTSCHDTGKKVCKSEQKSKPVSVTEPHLNVTSDTSANVSKSGQSEDVANCNILSSENKTADDVTVASDHVQVADFLAGSESLCDADNVQLLCTIGELTDNNINTVSLDQTDASSRTISTVTSDDVDKTILFFDTTNCNTLSTADETADVTVAHDYVQVADFFIGSESRCDADNCEQISLQMVSSGTVVDSELTRLSVKETDNATEEQWQHQDTDTCPAVYQCDTADKDKQARQPEMDITLDIGVNDVTKDDTTALNNADYCAGNSNTGDAAAAGSDNVANDDDDDDSDSWEKMFDDSGTLLHQSDDMAEEVKSCYNKHVQLSMV